MNASKKKITYVIHYRNRKENLVKTLNSILDQDIHHIYYDVLILDDCSEDQGRLHIEKYIEKNKLVNFTIISFKNHLGFANLFNFVNKSNQIKSEYVTFLKSGDLLAKDWMKHFLAHLYPLKQDMYLHRAKVNYVDFQIHSGNSYAHSPKKVVKRKKKLIGSQFKSGKLNQNDAISTLHFFFGKIFRFETIKNINVFTEKILYQELYIYQKIISASQTFYYDKFIAGQTRFSPISRVKMDAERIKLFCATIDLMVDHKKPILNGWLIKMITIALHQSAKEDHYNYQLNSYKNLANFQLKSIPGLPIFGFLVKKATKELLETGKAAKSINE